ncbi:xylitol dehydrogenase [Moesziomyces antarcticus]|uniref:Xylitol dehydrogenase n=2 Tax=Pseudozyma antarctica TaxID=84753 RepID=A0A081CF78_PSEA2|nr:xylitol dehydrogenase [Moesziomyces antarcticus]GAK65324.1 xylitol dehydrogenase [Moesziomyces antarcticus]SPO46329.1 probable xylitol dehydrogenase [Moesziomyces antarcticus]
MSAQVAPNNSLATTPAEGNVSFVLQEIEKVSFEDRPVVAPKRGQVQVNIRQTGLCASDCHYLHHGRIGDFVVRKPMVLGHESSGIVTAVGEGVTTHKVGDRVALEPGVPCGGCHSCLQGSYNHCPDLEFAATPPYDGTLCTYYNIMAPFAHHVPDTMSLEEASLMEPLSVAVYSAAIRGQVKAMENVLVFGAGPIGLLNAAVCKAYSAKRVVVVDVVDNKLEFAKGFCATSTFKPSLPKEGEAKIDAATRNAQDLIKSIGDDVGAHEGFDLVLECTGAEPCIQMGIQALRPKGRFVQVGMGRSEVEFPITRVCVKEIDVTGSFRYGAGAYKTSISLVSTGLIDVTKMVTHRFLFKDAIKAFDTTTKGVGEDGKTAIKVQISQGEGKH